MSLKIALFQKPPCPKCPYQLGQVHTPVNPCPACKLNNYQMFQQFQKQIMPHQTK